MLFELLENEVVRMKLILVAMMLAMCFLILNLWQKQVLQHGEFISSHEKQSLRRVRLPAARGKIYDRNGVCLAENRPNYSIAIYVEELRQTGGWEKTIEEVQRTILRLSRVIDLPPVVGYSDIKRHIIKRLPLPFIAWRDVDQRVIARWYEHATEFKGVDIYVEPVRTYPNGKLAAHILGYIGKADLSAKQEEENYHYYLPEVEGKDGIEKQFNKELAGEPGVMLIRVDVSGFKSSQIIGWEPKAGMDVILTIDSQVQKTAEQMLEGEKGAVVVIDVRNGDIIAMASSPSFDPNYFVGGGSDVIQKLIENEAHPLYNRAISGLYPPGSTFKPVVAMAAIDSGVASQSTSFECNGQFVLGNMKFACWRKRGHGSLDMAGALEQSCNVYFCNLGTICGPENIIKMARLFGFGKITGVDLPGEKEGLVPDKEWKRKVMKEGWRGGDTCNMSIGQGALLVTPLQMVLFTTAIATKGKVYVPRIVAEPDSDRKLLRQLSLSEKGWNVIREGMERVVNVTDGTGKRAALPGIKVAGKTGTAEYGPKDARRKYGWMIAYAPAGDPQYAAVVVIENAVSGGITAAPRMREIMARLFRKTVEIEIETTEEEIVEVDG